MIEKSLLLISVGLLGWLNVLPPEAPVLLIGVYCIVTLTRSLGRDIPIIEITSAVYWLQILFCPLVAYYTPPRFPRYVMAVDPDTYFRYAIPAVCAYLLPLAIARSKTPYLTQVMRYTGGVSVFNAGVFLFVLGLGFSLVGRYVPPSLAFVFFLGGELKFVGALYCYFSRHGQRRWMLVIVLGLSVFTALAMAMFHQLIIWGAILTSLVIAREMKRPTLSIRLGVMALGVLLLFGVQILKQDYRAIRSAHPSYDVLDSVIALTRTGQSRGRTPAMEVATVRFNQGWIISNVLRHTPRFEPYADGQTMVAAAFDSVVPRFLFPRKGVAGGRDNFRRFTGLQINNSTSMGISPAGEAYANFGPHGGIMAMLAYGTVFATAFYWVAARRKHSALFYLWLPLVFSQSIKAETELVVVLNHLVKAAIFSVAGYYAIHKLLFPRMDSPGSSQQKPPQTRKPRQPQVPSMSSRQRTPASMS